jgi:hypothetical protein
MDTWLWGGAALCDQLEQQSGVPHDAVTLLPSCVQQQALTRECLAACLHARVTTTPSLSRRQPHITCFGSGEKVTSGYWWVTRLVTVRSWPPRAMATMVSCDGLNIKERGVLHGEPAVVCICCVSCL